MSGLRSSQIETLRMVGSLVDASADEVSRHEERWFGATKQSLDRLTELGYLAETEYRRAGTGRGHATYSLTDKGRAAVAPTQQKAG